MTRFHAVSRERHGTMCWQRFSGYDFTANTHCIPVFASELATAARTIPIGLVERADQFVLVGILSLLPGQNALLGPGGRWLGSYVPSMFRSYPFKLLPNPTTGEWVFCVDEDSGLVVEAGQGGVSFWESDGTLSVETKAVADFLLQRERARISTEVSLAALKYADVIRSWELKVRVLDNEQRVEGLYRVDEALLDKLDNTVFLTLREASALRIAYLQMSSMENISTLHQFSKAQSQTQRTESAPHSSEVSRFGMVSDQSLYFD